MIDEDAHNTASMYLPLTDKTIGLVPSTWNLGNIFSPATVPLGYLLQFRMFFACADGWTMAFMHAWQPEYLEEHYPYNRENRIRSKTGRVLLDETLFKNLPVGTVYEQLGLPLYAMLVSEVGDDETKNSILQQCDDFFKPEWNEDRSCCYPVGKTDFRVSPL